MKKLIEHKDLLDFHFLAAPTLSPDTQGGAGGTKVAYKVSRANLEKDGYDSDLWLYDLGTGENRRLTESGDVDFLCWSRDGEQVLFAAKDGSKCHHAGKAPHTPFYAINVNGAKGGKPDGLFDIPHKAASLWDLGEERRLVLASFEPAAPDNPEGANFMTFEQVPFMTNGKGYTGQVRTGLGVHDGTRGAFQRLTPPTMDVTHVTLNEDRTEALIVARDYKDLKPLDNGVYRLDLTSGQCELLTVGMEFTFSCAVWDEDGDIIVTATDRRAFGANENPKLWLLQEGGLLCLTPELDVSFGHPIVSDTNYGCRDHEGEITASPLGFVCSATEGFKTRLCAVKDGRLRALTASLSSVTDYGVQGSRAVCVAYEGLNLPELYLVEGGAARRLTSFNEAFAAEHALSQPIHITFKGAGGLSLDGWYMRPTGSQEGDRCPAILHIHGGPKAAFGDIYHHEMQCWAAKGYAVLYCNPRGGDGRGGAFADIRGHYGDTDYRDLMDFMDWCVKNLKFVDASRLGVTGGSYGGYMVNWIITRTNRFRAAVSQRGIANWVSKFGGCDIGYYYVEDQHLGTPWKNPGLAWWESPIAWADRADTPTLFVHSTEDFRCELNQASQMFTALKVNGVEARLYVFKGENHELSRSGKPRNRLARLRVILEWFDSHVRNAR